MQSIRNAILWHVRARRPAETLLSANGNDMLKRLSNQIMCASTGATDQVMDRVIELVKKFDKVDAAKVTETADFQKDLSLDSLDRVELVMVFEEEFSVEIPDDKGDKLSCCADVAKYIVSGTEQKS
ncbi:Acyl carrier protein 3 [Morus notabilis]|uniref:Acyl carrier protein n=1 Tax=Morus notabilis TaxID=981085 RepID=W9QL11_9ROSA|nr:acyl carrier protein 3, mitochondrial [Morus notabilis]XP_024022325.1 acyl carrier protein 3, mitochondrial [Morus notabilis]EXB29552.1 Acyl carrier protein 3 [Morus notabilis]